MAQRQPVAEEKPATAPHADGFAPRFSTHLVAALTLGRQTFNGPDKSNHFEGCHAQGTTEHRGPTVRRPPPVASEGEANGWNGSGWPAAPPPEAERKPKGS